MIRSRAAELTSRVQARLVRALTPEMRRALERIHEALREAADDPRVMQLVVSGRINDAVDLVLGHERVGVARTAVRAELSGALAKAGTEWSALLVTPTVGVRIAYPALNAAAMRALDRLDTQFFPPIFEETRKAFTIGVRAGLDAGTNPRVVARGLRNYVGLTEYDANIISTFQLQLRGNPAAALARTLRDARFDGTIRRAMAEGVAIPEARIASMVEAYAERLVNWRAETWARTSALNATREANLSAWSNAADALGIADDDVEKGWSTTLDGRERPEHNALDGTWVGMNETFPNGAMTPGEGEWNCRCVMVFRLRRAAAAGAKARQA